MNQIETLELKLGELQLKQSNNDTLLKKNFHNFPKNSQIITLDELTNEVGTLTSSKNDNVQGKYIGAVTGSNFAKAFLKQIKLENLDDLSSASSYDFSGFDPKSALNSTTCAPLPPYSIAKLAVNKYINCVHPYYAIIELKEFLNSFEMIYSNPKSLTYHEKYIIFMILAIGLERGEKIPELINYYNQFKPIEYYNTAQKYLSRLITFRSILSLQEILLMMIWCTNTNVFKDDSGDLWYCGRYIMALAMELDLYLDNKIDNLTESKIEFRHRLFWASYLLERSNTIKFGRALSIRKQDIQIQLPKLLPDDDLSSNTLLNDYNQVRFIPGLISIELYEIYGILLETVYISRTKGSKPLLSLETIIDYKIKIQESIAKLLVKIDREIPNSLAFYYELKIKSYIASIILNRPSPSFPNPDSTSLLRCKDDCLNAIELMEPLTKPPSQWKTHPSCLHDLINIGLTMIYCCWKTEKDSTLLKNFTNLTVKIMNEMIVYYPCFIKFKNLFIFVSSVIIQNLNQICDESKEDEIKNDDVLMRQEMNESMKNVPTNIANSRGDIGMINNNYIPPFYLQQETELMPQNPSSVPTGDLSFNNFNIQSGSEIPTGTTMYMPQPQQPLQPPQTHIPNNYQDQPIFNILNESQLQPQQQFRLPPFSKSCEPVQKQHQQVELQSSLQPPLQPTQHRMPLQNMNIDDGFFMNHNNNNTNSNNTSIKTQDLFHDVFNRYYFQSNESLNGDIASLFEFQKFNWDI